MLSGVPATSGFFKEGLFFWNSGPLAAPVVALDLRPLSSARELRDFLSIHTDHRKRRVSVALTVLHVPSPKTTRPAALPELQR